MGAEMQKRRVVVSWLRGLAGAGLLLGLGVVVTDMNAQSGDIPLAALAGIALAEVLRRPGAPRGDLEPLAAAEQGGVYRLRVCAASYCTVITVLGFFVADFSSVAYSWTWKTFRSNRVPPSARFATVSLQDMLCPAPLTTSSTPDAKPWNSFDYPVYVNTGVELLRDHTDRESRIVTMDWCNPFPVALQLPAPRGVPLHWHGKYLMDDSHHPAADVVFQEVTHVMVPKRPIATPEDLALIHHVCATYLEEHFAPCAESQLWILYLRKPGP
jgi:hypothetical protein